MDLILTWGNTEFSESSPQGFKMVNALQRQEFQMVIIDE